MQIYLDKKIIFINFCIHINCITNELANNVLLIIAVMILLQRQGSEGITSPDYPCPARLWGCLYPTYSLGSNFIFLGFPSSCSQPVSEQETPSDWVLPQIQQLGLVSLLSASHERF